MGQLRTAKAGDKAAFPSTSFVIEGDVPESQCSEAVIQSDEATSENDPFYRVFDTGAFVGLNLVDKNCVITSSVGGNTGTFNIAGNQDDFVTLDDDPGVGDPVSYHITDGPSFIESRDVPSFAEYIHEQGGAYTIKGGQLYTDMGSVALQPACSILFSPLP